MKPIGLGARDSLRLEAGLCLYGHDIDETTSPGRGRSRLVDRQAPPQRRRLHRAPAASAGADATAPPRKRVGIKPEGRAPAREGTLITDDDGRTIGTVTSGGFGPTVNGPIAMGYVETPFAASRNAGRSLIVRDKPLPAARRAAALRAPHLQTLKETGRIMTARYTKDHEWITVDGDVATVGITNHAQEQLGDVVFVELPAVGKAGDQGRRGGGGRDRSRRRARSMRR